MEIYEWYNYDNLNRTIFCKCYSLTGEEDEEVIMSDNSLKTKENRKALEDFF